MKQISLSFLAAVSISFFLMSCAASKRSGTENSGGYYNSSMLKPGLSVAEVQDLMNSPSQISSAEDAFGRPWSIWFFDYNALPSTSPQIPSTLVFSFDFGRANHPLISIEKKDSETPSH